MKRILALLALLSLALVLPVAAPAKKSKKSHHHATVLKGAFRAVGADGAYTDKKFGKAHLVDNRRRDKLSVHLRHLAPRTVYTFALYSVAKGQPRCQEGASGGIQETAFAPKSKRTNKRGNLNANQRSKTFKAVAGRRYFVLVSDGTQVVACAKLNGKRARAGCKPHRAHPGRPHSEHPAKPRKEHPAKARKEHPAKPPKEHPAKAPKAHPGKPHAKDARKRGCKRHQHSAQGKGRARR
jgi:hypothetical protein